MNKDTLKGDWKLIKGKIKEKWGKFTDDDLTEINGKREQLLGKIQKKYGLAKEEAEQELDEWEKRSENHSINEEVDESEDEREIRHTKH
ncbi:hypothetical protein PNK_1827 [Candidatus Protochlamydia naegleriophila]|uniref:CsbD-like domain-containing protein n=1 Tax=Candidatus Protochlamydia naegleriophila TaxID=389348 RepID=A0A0U5JF36_9BACT|nr:hypothetical protein PNK_1827 [Candidatus Protochlamydia naegleriophila]